MLPTKNKNISWAWWCAPIVPVTQEAEAGGLLEPRSSGLQCTMIVPAKSHCTPALATEKDSGFYFLGFFFSQTESCSVARARVQSGVQWLIATSTSWVQAILLP